MVVNTQCNILYIVSYSHQQPAPRYSECTHCCLSSARSRFHCTLESERRKNVWPCRSVDLAGSHVTGPVINGLIRAMFSHCPAMTDGAGHYCHCGTVKASLIICPVVTSYPLFTIGITRFIFILWLCLLDRFWFCFPFFSIQDNTLLKWGL